MHAFGAIARGAAGDARERPGVTEAHVFVNYRRKDAPGSAGRLTDDLADRFGEHAVFRDVQMRPGIDFVDEITRAAGSCHVLLAVIGPRWATVAGPDGTPRLQDPGDFVRLEIETALARADVVVIPVLVEDAVMPSAAELPPSLKELARLNASRLSDASWDYDVARLGDVVAPILTADDVEDEPAGPAEDRGPDWSTGVKVAGTSLAIGPVALVLSDWLHDRPSATGADKIGDIGTAGERVAYYAVERGITWAVVGAVILATWVALTRAGRPPVGAALAGAWAGGVGGLLAGLVFQGSKYLHNPALGAEVNVPTGVTARAAGYALAAALIGWTLARTTQHLSRLEGATAGAAAGIVAAFVTAATSGSWRGLGLGVEALIVGGSLAFAAIAAHKARAGGALVRLEVPLRTPRIDAKGGAR